MTKLKYTYYGISLIFLCFALTSAPLSAQGSYAQAIMERAGKSSYIQGLEAFTSGEYEKARTLLEDAYAKLGAQPGISYALADTYLILDDLPRAVQFGKEAVAGEPNNKWFRLKLARIYRSAGQNEATLEALNELRRRFPADFDVLYLLADTYKDYGEFVQSNQVLNRILELTGPDEQVFLLKFSNFESMGIADSALAQLEALRDADPDNLKVLNMLGEYYNRTGRGDNAREVLSDALQRNARDPQSLINLAGIYIRDQKWDSAGTLLQNFVSDTLNSPEEKMIIARFMFGRSGENPENAELRIQTAKVLEAFTNSESGYGPAFTLAGQFYAESGKNNQALDKLKRANELLPQDDIAWRQRLQLLLSENRLTEAIDAGNRANQAVPEDAFIQFFTGSAYMLKGEYEAAEEWLENAVRAPARRPFKSAVYSTLGDVKASLDKQEDSDRAYETALRYDRENHTAMNNYAYNLAIREGDLEKAEELVLAALELSPQTPSYLDTAGWVYYKMADYEKARRYVQAAVDSGEASAEVMEHLGDIYDKLGQPEEARKWWQKALDADPEKSYLKNKIQS